MKHLKNTKGLTLVEIILSLAILGLITISFLSMFVLAFKGVFAAGNFSQAQYLGQKTIENRVAGLPAADNHTITSNTITDATITLDFGLISNIEVSGKLESVLYDDGRHHVDLSTFLPD